MTDWMTQDLVNTRNYHDLFKRITRYTFKPIGIIVDRMAPPNNEPTVDPEGEWMKCEQLNNIIYAGGVLVNTPEVAEMAMDAAAQRGLMRDLSNLGYIDFEQVMTILKNNRHQLLDQKEYEIWIEGYATTGNISEAVRVTKEKAFSFHEAIQQYVNSLEPEQAKRWNYSKDLNVWTMWGCRVFDNETDARKAFG